MIKKSPEDLGNDALGGGGGGGVRVNGFGHHPSLFVDPFDVMKLSLSPPPPRPRRLLCHGQSTLSLNN
jgi:hypothetical protein